MIKPKKDFISRCAEIGGTILAVLIIVGSCIPSRNQEKSSSQRCREAVESANRVIGLTGRDDLDMENAKGIIADGCKE